MLIDLAAEGRKEDFVVKSILSAKSEGFTDEEFPDLFARVLERIQSRDASRRYAIQLQESL